MKEEKKNFYKVLIAFLIALLIFTTIIAYRELTKPLDIVVALNPNHGGKYAPASQTDGDRYDERKKRFTTEYKEGLYYKNLSEFELLLNLCKKLYKILEITQTKSGWEKFQLILKKYSNISNLRPVIFEPLLTKERDYKFYQSENNVNKYFRIMDSPSYKLLKTYERGVLSFLFKYKPDIILNFDLNYKDSNTDNIFFVQTPSYDFFNFIRNKIISSNIEFDLSEITNSEYKYIITHWWGKTLDEKIRNLLTDTWVYFTAYLPQKNYLAPDLSKFVGFGYNMFNWDFRDAGKWYDDYDNKESNPHYHYNLKLWSPAGKFWEREQMGIEIKRRQVDNLYASKMMIKYIASENIPDLKFEEPVFCYDEILLYTTGISININLGSIYKKRTRTLLTEYIDKLAEAICIGLYSISADYNSSAPIDFEFYHKSKYCGKNSRR